MTEDRPSWAQRIRDERAARGWTQVDLLSALRAHSQQELPGQASMLRQIKKWEAGGSKPDEFYRPLIAKTFGTVTAAIWPVEGSRNANAELIATTGMDTLEILTRLRSTSVDEATMEGLRITVDRLCSEYPHMPAEQLLIEGREWLQRMTTLLSRQLSYTQHRELLSLAGWLAALVGCVEYDTTNRAGAEATRKIAFGLGEETGDAEVMAWTQEMRAWFSITRGDYRGVLAAAEAGHAMAPNSRAAVQLHAQKAKAWARIGDRRQVEVALDQGRTLLERLPHPDNLDHHFAVDPAKWDFYSMDCYRVLGATTDAGSTENKLATSYAHRVIQAGTDHSGIEHSPMRNAEARITLGVVAAREGDLESALSHGKQALEGERRSVPSLLMVSRDLATIINERYASVPDAATYLERLRELRDSAA